MSTHTLKIQTRWLERVVAGGRCAEIRKHDRDYQAGDLIEFVEVNGYGSPVTHFIERDERGRFVNRWVDNRHSARILHVLDGRLADGIADDYCLLSIEYLGAVE